MGILGGRPPRRGSCACGWWPRLARISAVIGECHRSSRWARALLWSAREGTSRGPRNRAFCLRPKERSDTSARACERTCRTSEVDDLPPCVECGACCFSNLETSIRVTGDDHERLGAAADELVHFVGNRAYMRLSAGHCAALAAEGTGQFLCRVYESRPTICRELARGSPQCAGERFTKGSRPRARLVQLRRSAK